LSQIFISCFQHVAKDIERWLNFGALYLVYSQIWLSLPRDDCHFFNKFPLDDSHFGCIRKCQKKNTVVVSRWYEKLWLVYECLTVIQRCLYLFYGRLSCPCPEMKKDWNIDGVPWGRMLLFLFSCLPSKLREYFCQEIEHIADWINLSFRASLIILANFSKKRKFYFKKLILEVFIPQKWGKKK